MKFIDKERYMFWYGILLGVAGGIIGNILVTSAFNLIVINSLIWNVIFMLISFAMLIYLILWTSKKIKGIRN